MGKHSIFKAFVKHEGSRVDSIDPWFSFKSRSGPGLKGSSNYRLS